jgi:hypothetical protein
VWRIVSQKQVKNKESEARGMLDDLGATAQVLV